MATSPSIRGSMTQISSLKCVICCNALTEPKLLDCAHTFCISCLSKLLRQKTIVCPYCREHTSVPGGDVANLKTNLALRSVVEDVRNLEAKCDKCGSLTTRNNLSFCSECCIFMCGPCVKKHNKDKGNANHKVDTNTLTDISSAISSPPYCEKHSGESCVSVCILCGVQLCKHCKQSHIKEGHDVKSITTHIYELFGDTMRLQEDFKIVTNACSKNMFSAIQNVQKVRLITDEVEKNINQEYKILAADLNARKQSLIRSCETLRSDAVESSNKMSTDLKESLSVAASVRAITENMIDSPFQSISTHESYFRKNREKATEMKERIDQSMKLSNKICKMAEKLQFVKSKKTRIPIGFLETQTWEKTDIALGSNKMTDTAVSPDGKVSVGYFDGGIEFLSPPGSKRTVLKQIKVLAIAWFTDGDLALRDIDNGLSIYDTDLNKSNVTFTTLGHEEGGEGVIVVNSENKILMSYRHVSEIHIFAKQGGNAFRVINCEGCIPQQIASTLNSGILVMDAAVVKIIDEQGSIRAEIKQPGYFGYPAVMNDGSVLIAWVKEDEEFVRIEHYTYELKTLRTVLVASLDSRVRKWYKLQVISNDKIYFCSPSVMHFFSLYRTPFKDEWSTWF